MASVCGGSLAMMDAGVPIKAPVAGIAMGLVMDETTGKYAVLSDIAGAEDHYGDMDFKVAGTANGITALQMDIKVTGITTEVMKKALEQARQGRLHILDKMRETIRPRESISTFAPQNRHHQDSGGKIRDVIGPGGKMIRSIIERTGVKIDVEDDGRVNVASSDSASAQKAISIIQELTATPELNKTYLGKVQRITDFGAFVEIMAGTDGLLHVSEIANHRVKDVRDELKEGEQLLVKVINIDPTGKIRLSRKALLTEEARRRKAPGSRRVGLAGRGASPSPSDLPADLSHPSALRPAHSSGTLAASDIGAPALSGSAQFSSLSSVSALSTTDLLHLPDPPDYWLPPNRSPDSFVVESGVVHEVNQPSADGCPGDASQRPGRDLRGFRAPPRRRFLK